MQLILCLEKIYVFVFLILYAYSPVLYCNCHQCQTTTMKVIAKRKLPSTDFKGLFTLEDKTFGQVFQKCYKQCKMNDRCIGFEICKISEDLFSCQACCKWKKRKDYGSIQVVGPSDCSYYEQV